MSEISKEELIANTEAQLKVAVILEKITGSLGGILENQDKIMSNIGDNKEHCILCSTKIDTILSNTGTIKTEVFWVKTTFGILAFAISLGVLIAKITSYVVNSHIKPI